MVAPGVLFCLPEGGTGVGFDRLRHIMLEDERPS